MPGVAGSLPVVANEVGSVDTVREALGIEGVLPPVKGPITHLPVPMTEAGRNRADHRS